MHMQRSNGLNCFQMTGNTALLANTSFTHYQIVNGLVRVTAGVDRKPQGGVELIALAEPIYKWYRNSSVIRANIRSININTTVDKTSKKYHYHYDINYRPKVDDWYYKSGNMILAVGGPKKKHDVPVLLLIEKILLQRFQVWSY